MHEEGMVVVSGVSIVERLDQGQVVTLVVVPGSSSFWRQVI